MGSLGEWGFAPAGRIWDAGFWWGGLGVEAGVLFLSLGTSGTGPEAKRVWLGCWVFLRGISLSFCGFGRIDIRGF